MSIRRLTAMAAGGLLMTLAAGQLSPLQAQASGTVEADADIVREVTTRNLLELRVADIGRKKTSNPSVKSFAEQMQADHLKMNDEVTALKGQDGRPFRTPLGKMEAQVVEVRRLEKFSGSQFDKEFMASQIRGHQDNVVYFRSASNSAQSTQVRALLANELPVLEQHLNQAVQLGNQIGAGAVVATGGPNPATPTQYPSTPTQYPSTPTQYPAPPTPNPTTQNPLPTTQSAPAVTKKDRDDFKKDIKFVREAIADNTLEIRLAEAAQRSTANGEARQLATRMLADHTAMQRQWIDLATRHGMTLTPSMGRRHQAKVKKLENTSGAQFDQAYTTMEVQNNQDYAEYFQKEGAATHSAQVRSQAANDLLSIRQHLAGAKKVALRVGVDTTAALRARNLSSYKNQ